VDILDTIDGARRAAPWRGSPAGPDWRPELRAEEAEHVLAKMVWQAEGGARARDRPAPRKL